MSNRWNISFPSGSRPVGPPNLTDDDAVGALSQRLSHQVAQRDGPTAVLSAAAAAFRIHLCVICADIDP
jgi:hypothetical protein